MCQQSGFEITGIRRLRTDRPSRILDSLDSVHNLIFSNRPSEITVLWLNFTHNPVILGQDIRQVKAQLRKDKRLIADLENSPYYECRSLHKPYNLDDDLPSCGNTIPALQWAHLFSHIALLIVHFGYASSDKTLPDFIEDSVFYNPANPEEICIGYNLALRTTVLGSYMAVVEELMSLIASGTEDPDFWTYIEGHHFLHQTRREISDRFR